MTPKKLQKSFYISDEQVKLFIDNYADDLSILWKCSTSLLIEIAVLNYFLPENKEARDLVLNNLYRIDRTGGVKVSVKQAFELNSYGDGRSPKYDNFKPLVKFCIDYIDYKAEPITDDTLHTSCFLSNFKLIVDEMTSSASMLINPYDRCIFQEKAKLANTLYEGALANLKTINFKALLQLIWDFWELLKDWYVTYRFLSELASLAVFVEDPNSCVYFCEHIKSMSKEWQEEK